MRAKRFLQSRRQGPGDTERHPRRRQVQLQQGCRNSIRRKCAAGRGRVPIFIMRWTDSDAQTNENLISRNHRRDDFLTAPAQMFPQSKRHRNGDRAGMGDSQTVSVVEFHHMPRHSVDPGRLRHRQFHSLPDHRGLRRTAHFPGNSRGDTGRLGPCPGQSAADPVQDPKLRIEHDIRRQIIIPKLGGKRCHGGFYSSIRFPHKFPSLSFNNCQNTQDTVDYILYIINSVLRFIFAEGSLCLVRKPPLTLHPACYISYN